MKNADAYKTCISNANLADTGFSYTLSLINGKYKMTILYTLMSFGVVRFNEMKKYIGEISYKTLSSTLKELEADQLVHREEYPQIPPKVEYSLTERGKSLIPILVPLFISAFRRAEELAMAMEARCYHGDEHRTRMNVMTMKSSDYRAAVMVVAYAVVIIGLRFVAKAVPFII